jgi:hypothetical protein
MCPNWCKTCQNQKILFTPESIREFEKPASKEAAGQPPAMLTQIGVQTIKA